MKFYHVHPESSLKKQPVAVKELFVTFFVFIFLTGSYAACDFGGYPAFTTRYSESIAELRDNLPADYNLTVLLQDTVGMDSCCLDLQTILSLNRSIGHIYRNSLDKLQLLVTKVLGELQFFNDCTIRESFNCEATQWNSTHLLTNLDGRMQSFDANQRNGKCRLNECILYSCTPGHIKTTLSTATYSTGSSVEELGNFTSGVNSVPTTNDEATSSSNVTNPQLPSAFAPPTTPANGNNPSPSLNSGNLTNGNNLHPSIVNGSVTTLTNRTNASLSLTSDTLNNESYPLSAPANGSQATLTNGTSLFTSSVSANLVNGTSASPVNITQPTVDDQSNDNPMSLTISSEGHTLAARICSSQMMLRTAALVLVVSVFANVFLLSCLLRRKRQQVSAQITEMEPLSSIRVEHQELWSQEERRRR